MASTTHKHVEVREAKYGYGYEVVKHEEGKQVIVARTYSEQSKELAECVAKLITVRRLV
jgi:ribosomal protein L30E